MSQTPDSLRPRIVRYLRGIKGVIPRIYGRLSYAQEGEDLVLARAFDGQTHGFYVDIGAHHPRRFSNTYLFYRAGWSGINIDAMPGSMKPFRRARRRDINLELAVGEESPPKTFFVFNDPALNTFDPEQARSYQGHNYKIVAQYRISTRPLSVILREHLPIGRNIDFLSVDVEGLDLEVLRSNDWTRYRPRYVLTETLHVDLAALSGGAVYEFLCAQGYRLFAKTPNTAFFKLVSP